MLYKMNVAMWLELLFRLFLWLLFSWLDATEPFIREIHQNELWKYQYPARDSIISADCLWVIICVVPILAFLAEYVFTNNHEDIPSACLALTLSYGLNGVITSFIKVVIGRPRPDFYNRCFPDGKAGDLKQCVGDRKSYMDGRKSFPSGHASFAFCLVSFLSLYLVRKLAPFRKDQLGKSWKLALCIAPLLVGFAIAASRTCDYHHHYEDVSFGAVLGTLISYMCYKLYFPNEIETN